MSVFHVLRPHKVLVALFRGEMDEEHSMILCDWLYLPYDLSKSWLFFVL